jgi:hypothetical protein
MKYLSYRNIKSIYICLLLFQQIGIILSGSAISSTQLASPPVEEFGGLQQKAALKRENANLRSTKETCSAQVMLWCMYSARSRPRNFVSQKTHTSNNNALLLYTLAQRVVAAEAQYTQ